MYRRANTLYKGRHCVHECKMGCATATRTFLVHPGAQVRAESLLNHESEGGKSLDGTITYLPT